MSGSANVNKWRIFKSCQPYLSGVRAIKSHLYTICCHLDCLRSRTLSRQQQDKKTSFITRRILEQDQARIGNQNVWIQVLEEP